MDKWLMRVMVLLMCLAFGTSLVSTTTAQTEPPSFTKNAFLNGMEILFLTGTSDRSNFVLMIKNGAAFDPAGKWGATHLMARAMLERTERRSGDQIRQELALMNAEIRVRVDWDAIFFEGSAPQNRLADALNVLAEIVTKPRFEEEPLERIRADFLNELAEETGRAGRVTQQRFREELFKGNPYGHSVEGSVETVNALSVADLKIQYRRLMIPNQAQLAVEFSGDTAGLFRGLGRSWGGWIRGTAVPFTFRQADALRGTKTLILDRSGEDGLLRLGNLGVVIGSQDYYVLKVLEQYLTLCLPDWADEVASDSQIQGSVRLEARRMPGYLQISIKAPAGLLADYVAKIQETLSQLKNAEVDEKRFRESKELAVLELREALREPVSRLNVLLRANLYDLGLRYMSTYGLRLERVTPAKLKSALLKYFPPDSLLMVVAGPADQISPLFEKFGVVEILN